MDGFTISNGQVLDLQIGTDSPKLDEESKIECQFALDEIKESVNSFEQRINDLTEQDFDGISDILARLEDLERGFYYV